MTVAIHNLTDTWNDAGTTFTAIKMNVTDTNSAAASLLLDLQIGGTSKLKVGKAQVLSFNGTAAAPAYSFINRTDSGMSWESGGNLQLSESGTNVLNLGTISKEARLPADFTFAWSSATANNAAADVVLLRDAADVLAQRRTTNAQTLNLYDTWASTSDYHRVAIKTARATLSNVSGASVVASGLIPDGAVLVGLTSKVTTGLGTGNGTTGYNIGDGSDADRWGAVTGTAAGTSSDNTDWTATTVQAFTAAQDVTVTAVGGNFDGTGVIYLSAQYLIGQCD